LAGERSRGAGFSITEIDAGTRVLPHPTEPDLNTILPNLRGLSLRISKPSGILATSPTGTATRNSTPNGHGQAVDATADIAPMLQAFRLAYTNLQEIWSLVLPPNTLLGLKRLSLADGAAFRMPEGLWARIVYDFVLAHGCAPQPRPSAWRADTALSCLGRKPHQRSGSGVDPERHIETVAQRLKPRSPISFRVGDGQTGSIREEAGNER